MEENKIFGSNVKLPSLPGLQSDCEEEILLLMQEVDFEFQRKHKELLEELKNVRSLCRDQSNEIENLRCVLMPTNETVKNASSLKTVKSYSNQIENLEKENSELKSINYTLEKQIRQFPDKELQLDSLKRSLLHQQDENKSLKEKLFRIEEHYQSLQGSYQKVVSAMVLHRQSSENHAVSKTDGSSAPNLIEDQISQTTEKFIAEENEFCNDFQFKINQQIDDLERRLQKEIT